MGRSKYIVLFMWLSCVISAFTQRLKFDAAGHFKIVQFTDVHYIPDNPKSKIAIRLIDEVLEQEKPDLVVLTGDIVTGHPAKKGWDSVLSPVLQQNIPFMVTLGNHDDEQDLSRKQVAELVVSYPLNLNTICVDSVTGYLNDALPIMGHMSGRPAFLLYGLDSNNYSTIQGIKGYGWFTPDQIEWYNCQSCYYKSLNEGKALPALAFFHIPLPEYRIAYDMRKNRKSGKRREKECAPELNTGMYATMLLNGDVIGMFTGHDHGNDYIALYNGIALAYGRFSGGKTTYTKTSNGARIIELQEGKRGFSTYIRLLDGKIVGRSEF
ncbi:metallophosphoesterase family protein [Coprobacter sp.]